jgi:peptidoglycan/LPS O-acetylase OafA/YrhL
VSASRAARLAELDALRGVAVVMVLLYHYTTRFAELFPRALPLPFDFPQGEFGVELFFLISGFVITMTLDRSKCASDFLVARFSRLYPAYWVAVLLSTFVLVEAAGPFDVPSARQVAFNLTMVQGFFHVPSVDGVYWTLEVELLFYALALALFTTGYLRRLEKPLLIWLALAALFASPLWDAYVDPLPLTGGLAKLLILPYAPFFAIGILFHRLYRGEGSRLRNHGLMALALAIVVFTAPLAMVAVTLAGCLAFSKLTRGGIPFLRLPPLVFLGTISYSLYLVHQKMGHIVMAKMADHGVDPAYGLIVAALISIAVATALTFLVERPALNAIRDWYKKSSWRAKRHAAAAAR